MSSDLSAVVGDFEFYAQQFENAIKKTRTDRTATKPGSDEIVAGANQLEGDITEGDKFKDLLEIKFAEIVRKAGGGNNALLAPYSGRLAELTKDWKETKGNTLTKIEILRTQSTIDQAERKRDVEKKRGAEQAQVHAQQAARIAQLSAEVSHVAPAVDDEAEEAALRAHVESLQDEPLPEADKAAAEPPPLPPIPVDEGPPPPLPEGVTPPPPPPGEQP